MKGVKINADQIEWHLQRRRADGGLTPCRLVIETKTGIIIKEKCGNAKTSPTAQQQGTISHLEHFGIPYEVKQQDGKEQLIVKAGHAPERTKRIMQFFHLEGPCPFPGCDELRARYRKELDNLGPNCPGCQQGELMRTYMRLVEDLV